MPATTHGRHHSPVISNLRNTMFSVMMVRWKVPTGLAKLNEAGMIQRIALSRTIIQPVADGPQSTLPVSGRPGDRSLYVARTGAW